MKEELNCEPARSGETKISLTDQEIKLEPDDEDSHMTQKQTNASEDSCMYSVIKKEWTSSTSHTCPDEERYLYCEKCKLKYEGNCPEHGPQVYIDNAETKYDHDCSQDLNSHVQIVDNMERQVLGCEKVEQSGVCGEYEEKVSKNTESRTIKKDEDTEAKIWRLCRKQKQRWQVHQRQKKLDKIWGDKVNHRKQVTQHEANTQLTTDVISRSYQRMQESINQTDDTTTTYICDVCCVGFTFYRQLLTHKRLHAKKYYKCDMCGARYSQSHSLKIHKRIHTGEKPYKCDICGTGFTNSGGFKIHKRTHTGEKPYKCDVCGAGFSQNGNLKTHKRLHAGEKQYKCDVYGEDFSQSQSKGTQTNTYQ